MYVSKPFLLKKLIILSIDTWGENPFFRPLLVQAKFLAVDGESLTPTQGASTEGEGNKSGPCRAPGKNPIVGVLKGRP